MYAEAAAEAAEEAAEAAAAEGEAPATFCCGQKYLAKALRIYLYPYRTQRQTDRHAGSASRRQIVSKVIWVHFGDLALPRLPSPSLTLPLLGLRLLSGILN